MKPRTVDDLFNKVWKKYWDSARFQLSGHAPEVFRKYKKHIAPEFGMQKLGKVRKAEIRDWHDKMLATPIAANRSLEILARCYKYAIDREWFDGPNPCMGVQPYVERKRKRFATELEIGKIGEILEREKASHPLEVTFLYTLLFTGARPRSLERARWKNLINGELVFDGKSTEETGEKETLTITTFIINMLEVLPKREDGLIFGIKLPTHFWQRIRKEAGCEDLWARDFRRTYATIGMSNGVDMPVISKLLNHKSVQTTDRYAQLNISAKVKAVDQIEDKMRTLLTGSKVSNE